MTLLTRSLLAAFLLQPVFAQQIHSSVFLGANEVVLFFRPATDTNGDGKAEFVAVVRDDSIAGTPTYRVLLVSGSDATVIHQLGPASTFLPNDVIGFGDGDGDGHGDVVVSGPGLLVYSGATGALLYTHPQGYLSMCGIGDHDGNGRDDFAGTGYSSGSNFVYLLRGENGSQFGTLPLVFNSNGECVVRNAGDLSNDGIDDVVLSTRSGLTVGQDSVTGATMFSFDPMGQNESNRDVETIDLDQDGKREVILLRPSSVNEVAVYGGESGLLRYLVNPPVSQSPSIGKNACRLGDINCDGFVDFATVLPTASGELLAVSGRDGSVLWTLAGQPQTKLGHHIASISDIDGDGLDDFVASFADDWSSIATGDGWHVISSRVLAEVIPKEGACGGGPFLPRLGMTRPILGQPTTIVGLDGPVGVSGIVVFSLQPQVPTFLGASTCFANFELGAGLPLFAVTQPHWNVTVTVPLVPQFAGLPIALQCFYSPTNGPLGYDLSNGVWARLGY